jgi:hypothetical protein
MSSIWQKNRAHTRDAISATPARIMRIAFGFAPAQTLATALELRLFTYIAEGNVTCELVEKATGVSQRGLQMLLDAMVGLEFLTRQGTGVQARYGLTPEAEAYLVEQRPGYHGDLLCFHLRRLGAHLTNLTECVRSGVPVLDELADLLRAHQLLEAALTQVTQPEP